ncbi:MAG: S46 family peptidase, partial [Rhodothermales bacterium]|nr:S46 family peptidase [Rhodothermales bacterium]
DMTFFRVYEDGEPFQPEHYFAWSENGTREGDAVFIIGNPGSTLRLNTVAQLEWRRDHQERDLLALLDSRIAVLEEYYQEAPSDNLRNQIFGLKNGQKLYRGRVKGLNDPVLMAKRADTENAFLADLTSKYVDQMSADVDVPYLTIIDDLARIQEQKREYAREYGAFLAMGTASSLASATVRRAVNAHDFLMLEAEGVQEETLEERRQALLALADQPAGLNSRMLLARIRDLVAYFGASDPGVQRMLLGRTPEELASDILANSALADAERFAAAVESGSLSMDDPAIAMVTPFMERRQAFQSAFAGLAAQETELNAQHGRARFEVYGTSRPPDATFSLRIADGEVAAYEYNGTKAPAYTTFYGLYNRHYSHASGHDTTGEWVLPERWLNAPPEFDRSTPMNFVSTVDIIGGNSGSPVVNKALEIVGLAFDGNVEFLPSAFIFDTSQAGRTVSVDSRGMMEALDVVYDMDRLVLELQEGKLAPTEQEADEQRAG